MSRQEETALEYQNDNLNASPYDAFLAGYNHATEKGSYLVLSIVREALGCDGNHPLPYDIAERFKQVMEQ